MFINHGTLLNRYDTAGLDMNTEPNATNILHETADYLVTEEGELYQKDTSLFRGRKLGTIDTENPETGVEPYRYAFDQLQQQIRKRFSEIESLEDPEEKAGQTEALYEQLKQADAIGNFEELIKEIGEKRDEWLSLSEKNAAAADEPVETGDTVEGVTFALPDEEEQPPPPEEKEETEEPGGAISADAEEVSEETSATGEEPAETGGEASDTATEAENKEAEKGFHPGFEVPDELSFYLNILKKADELQSNGDLQYVSIEIDNLKRKWSEGPGFDEGYQETYDRLNEIFSQKQKEFHDRKAAHYDEVHQKKLKNLERKNGLLERLRSIVDQKRWHSLHDVQSIRKRWENIHLANTRETEALDRQYQVLIDEFEKKRVEYLVITKEKEEQNLTLKLAILDKIQNLLDQIDEHFSGWKILEREYNELLREWKKVGRVSREKSSETWQRYKELRDLFYEKKLTFDATYREEVETRYTKKQQLVKEAQTLVDADDLAQAARSINKLHKRWKEIGALPKEQSEELWTLFKKATDAFNEQKAENIDVLRDQENENYEAKVKLCIEAETIKDTGNWKEGSEQMQELMARWKTIGPVPRRKTHKVWHRFKKAMDEFYDRKRSSLREERQHQKENLKKKAELIEQIFKLGESEDPVQARELVKPLQKAFSEIGFVPIKQKNKIYKQYREACDAVYQRARSQGRGQPAEGKNAPLSVGDRKELREKRNLYNKLRKECDKLNGMILSYSDSQTFIRPNEQGLQLRKEIQSKIDKAREDLESKQDEMEELRQSIDEIQGSESS